MSAASTGGDAGSEAPKSPKDPIRRKLHHSLLWKLLLAFFLLSALPLAAAQWYVSHQLERVRQQTDRLARTYERRADKVAARVSRFLVAREADLRELAAQPRTDKAYLEFYRQKKNQVWLRSGTNEMPSEVKEQAPLFKEISFIDPDGLEQVLIFRGRPMAAEQRRDVSQPAQTTYKNERYFLEARDLKSGEFHVSRLKGFHVSKIEQLGVERIIPRLRHRSAQDRKQYRYLLFEALRAAGETEFVNSFTEDDRQMLVYRKPGEDSRILVENPKVLGPEQLQARELELNELIGKLAPEDVVEGERYDGVIRFAMPVFDGAGKLEGVVSLALDHIHLMQFTQHIKAMEEGATVFAGYRDADYTYLFDDQGWIITHPKQWNIKGSDRMGKAVPAYAPTTSATEKLVGRTPVNLLQLDWKMGEGYHALVLETRQGKTGIATSDNLAGVLRTRVYSPIFYEQGVYRKHGIFGGVMMGTRVDKFIELLRQMNSRISSQIAVVKRSIYWPLVVVLLLVVGLSILIARGLVSPLRALEGAARRIAEGDLETPIPQAGRDEIGVLAGTFSEMTTNLKSTIAQLAGRNKDLRQAQQKLLESEKAKQRELRREVAELQKEIARSSFSSMIAESKAMKKVQEEIVRVAASNATVLILGDNGTGKELVAEAIHRNSKRREQKFLKVNCAAFNDNLLESELFGHRKGAYTGADSTRKGLFEAAHNGTLLLDEVGDMSLEMQKKLLRTLQEGEVVPIGSSRVIKVDVRLVAVTNRNLNQLMDEGVFREDLYHRLNVISIHIPPLRDRRDDILPLAHAFSDKFAAKEDKPTAQLSPEVEDFLREYPWPGNVRELENAMERAIIRSRGPLLQVDDFQLNMDEKVQPLVNEASAEGMTLAQVEREYILTVLKNKDGNKKATAKTLDIGYNTLWRKLKKYKGEDGS